LWLWPAAGKSSEVRLQSSGLERRAGPCQAEQPTLRLRGARIGRHFLNPVDSKAAGEGVKKAHEAGIPVFTYDVQVTDEKATDLIVSHIGSDNYQGGLLAGESMMKVTGDKGKIAIITYPEVTSCILRVNGFKDYLKENNSRLEDVSSLNVIIVCIPVKTPTECIIRLGP
jgi:hypothetical protein